MQIFSRPAMQDRPHCSTSVPPAFSRKQDCTIPPAPIATEPSPITRKPPPGTCSSRDLAHLHEFNKKFLGKEHFDARAAALCESFYIFLCNPAVNNDVVVCQSPIHGIPPHNLTWWQSLSSPFTLWTTGFGQPDLQHSFLVEPCLDTCLHHVLCSGHLDITNLISLCATHPLVLHLALSIVCTWFFDSCWLQTYDPAWQHQTHFLPAKQAVMMACLLYYKLDISLLMCYLGNNYTGAYRIDHDTIHILRQHHTLKPLISK